LRPYTEADAAAAKQAAAASAEELDGSANGGDALADLKTYFESEVGRCRLTQVDPRWIPGQPDIKPRFLPRLTQC